MFYFIISTIHRFLSLKRNSLKRLNLKCLENYRKQMDFANKILFFWISIIVSALTIISSVHCLLCLPNFPSYWPLCLNQLKWWENFWSVLQCGINRAVSKCWWCDGNKIVYHTTNVDHHCGVCLLPFKFFNAFILLSDP